MKLFNSLTTNLAAEAGERCRVPTFRHAGPDNPPISPPPPSPYPTEMLRERVDSYLPDFGADADFLADAEDLQEACMGTALPQARPVDTDRILLLEPAPKDAGMGEILMSK